MRVFRKLRLGLVLLTLLNAVPALEADGSWWILGVTVVCAAASIAFARPDGGTRLPGAVVLFGVLASVLYSTVAMFAPQPVYILELAHFIIFLACCKFFELRTHRDLSLVAVIAFLLLVIGAFVSASPLFGVVIIIDATCGIAWLMAFQTDRQIAALLSWRRAALAPISTGVESFEGAQGDSAFGGESSATPPRASLWRPAMLHGAALLSISALVFISVPRGWGRGLFSRIQRAMPIAVTGFADEIQLTDTRIFEDPTLVMRARFLRGGRPLGGDDFQPYLRGLTFDRFRNGRWQRTRQIAVSELKTGRDGHRRLLPYSPAPPRDDPVIEEEIWLEAVGSGVLFSTYAPRAFGSRDLRRVQQSKSDLALETDETPRAGVSYSLIAAPADNGLSKSPDAPVRRDWAAFVRPSLHPAVWQFTREHFAQYGDFGDPRQHGRIAAAVRDFLRAAEFRYTLHRGSSEPETDRIKDFLFHNMQGHCEYFASAMVLMSQALGIPARLVKGFYGGQYNSVGGFYAFLAKDAHAWAEVWLAGRGWVVLDPSPGLERREVARTSDLLAKLQFLSDYLRFQWAATVVSFDAASRRDLFEAFQAWLRSLVELQNRPDTFGEGLLALLWGPDLLPLWQRFFYWLLLVLLVVFALLLFRVTWILSLMIRELWLRADHSAARLVRRPEARFYDRLLLLLAHKGHVKPRHLTPREFADELARAHADFADLPQFTAWFYQAQYAGRPLARDEWDRLKSVLTRLREDPAFGAR
jgi:transglutaminase-like putative cysteine protease